MSRYYSGESSRPHRRQVRFDESSQTYRPTPERIHFEPFVPRTRHQRGSVYNYRPEPVRVVHSSDEPGSRSRRHAPVTYEPPARPVVINRTRRRRQDEDEEEDEEDKADEVDEDEDEVEEFSEPIAGGLGSQRTATLFQDFYSRPETENLAVPISGSHQPDAPQYSEAAWLPDRNDGKYVAQDAGASGNPVEIVYKVDEVPRAQAYKVADAEVQSLDEPLYDRQFRPPSPIGGDLDGYAEFNFSFATPEPSKEDLCDLESPAVETDSSHREDNEASRPSNATQVYLSHYTGGAELGGSHGVELTTLHDPKGRKRPLFQWLHIQQETMNFDEFWTEVSRQIRLTEVERPAIAKLRADVKKHCIKTRQNPKGSRVGYMDPRCFEIPLNTFTKRLSPEEQPKGSARWICLPYFSLQQYGGLLSASNIASFPPQTLLQAQYSRTTEQRDMQQAVCQLGTAQRNECFHIAQLWCLVLDNKFVITCGNMAESALRGDTIKMNSQPVSQQAGLAGRILVVYGNAVTWSFPTAACSTWFQFLSNFHSFWPRNIQFKYNTQVITATAWPKILKLATRPEGSVTLKLETIPRPSPPRTILEPKQEATDKPKGSQAGTESKSCQEYLHVLMLRSPEERKSTTIKTTEALAEQLAAAEKFLAGQTSYSDQRAYKSCEDGTRDDAYSYLTRQASQVESRQSDSLRVSHEDRIDIFNAADDIYKLFFPGDFAGPTTGKYWSSIKSLLRIPELNEDIWLGNQDIVTETQSVLKDLSQDIRLFQSTMSFANELERARIDLPQPFVTAWLHIVSGLICANKESEIWLAHMSKAKVLILDGMNHVIQAISSRNIIDDSAVLPMEIVSLFSLKLLQDQVGKSDDIMDTYSQYLSWLDTEITTQPSDRSYQHRIDIVQQEIAVIRRTMAKQSSIIGSIKMNLSAKDGTSFLTGMVDDGPWRKRRAGDAPGAWRDEKDIPFPPQHWPAKKQAYGYDPRSRRNHMDYIGLDDQEGSDIEAASKLAPTDALGFRGLLLTECMQLVEQREFEFRRYTEYAEDLERAVAYSIDWTKDRQENAIYAFTIVTVVFLPLSAISSIFGMNTNDIRDMDFGQWLYWVVALPTTFIIIILGLWWMGELGNAVRWLTGQKVVADRSSGPLSRSSSWGYVSGVPPQMAEGTTFLVDPQRKTEMQYAEPRIADERFERRHSVSRPARYVTEQSAPVMRRIRRRPTSSVLY